jgi:hypothetical protein
MHIERVVLRFSGATMLLAVVCFVVWLSTGRRGWLMAAGGTWAAAVTVACAPLLLLALSKVVERVRR